MKTIYLVVIILLTNCTLLFSQVAINADGSVPNSSTILDIQSTSKGLLIPRMNVDQRNAIVNPADGLLVFCTNCGTEGALSLYSNGTWKTFSPCLYSAPPGAGAHVYSLGQITWKWNAVSGASGYRWNVTNNYTSALEMGTSLNKTETGIVCGTSYLRYVWSYNTCSASPATLLTHTITSASPPDPPSAGTQVPSYNQVTWNWNSVPGAAGYKWNTTNDFASATDMGSDTTKTETNLAYNATYTRYVWAYNDCWYSAPLTLTATLVSFICGSGSVTISHVAGTVAPVNKTVTYGTATGIPGETAKCWITSNLGADHQATAVDDATEASAGWYWQFNRKQGFKVADDSARTPNTPWITYISENSDWIPVNDPCALEMGSLWRLPTYTEWTNVDAAGNWTTWADPWGSALKMHAAGWYYFNFLDDRGISGNYWSSLRMNHDYGFFMSFSSSYSLIQANNKAIGRSVRCINCINPISPAEGTHHVMPGQIIWKWNALPGATGYKWSTSDNYNTAINLGNNTFKTEAVSSTCDTSYTRYIWAYNSCGGSPVTSMTLILPPVALPSAPNSGTHVPFANKIIWNWNAVTGATGYRWNTTSDFASATDMDISTTKTEANLVYNTAYTRYIWAYNGCGFSAAVSLTASTLQFSCGTDSITIDHLAGPVAPVNKTVTYGTSTLLNIAVCWITSNLGANHQATALNDTTEASAGWYWQFNRKQGYKHNGITRTPNTWINNTYEVGDWQSVNDPCAIEMGNGWRIPTTSEFYRADEYGNWTDWNGPWNSALKLHAAGVLSYIDGSLLYKGTGGYYWSKGHNFSSDGYLLVFGSGFSYTDYWPKFYGASIRCVKCIDPPSPVQGSHSAYPTKIVWNWLDATYGSSYKWNTTNDYATATNMGINKANLETGLTCNTTYTRYVWAYNSCGVSTATVLTQSTTSNPDAPAQGTHVPSVNQVVWNWNTVSDATGYKWNTTNDYASATDMGTATTKTETGLTYNTPYTRYAWAYCACGNSTPVSLNATTLPFTCGSTSITINHVAGTVAPVSKTVTYGTVTNVPGETSKCWITSNLGADHQATTIDDASEASAGWYWQFNLKQGFKLADDGTRTPGGAWINTIQENTDWQTAKDPCALELGNGWRIPTGTEWTNVDASGNWTNWDGPFNSALKMHTAGRLKSGDGTLGDRGDYGKYWSSSQNAATDGFLLVFGQWSSNMATDNKANGFTIRCIRN